MFGKKMSISRCANGWILFLPVQNEANAAMNMFGKIPGIIKGIAKDDKLEPPVEPEPIDPEHFLPYPIQYIDENVYIFMTFMELMKFIEMSFDQVYE